MAETVPYFQITLDAVDVYAQINAEYLLIEQES
jgi:hypothetical protein